MADQAQRIQLDFNNVLQVGAEHGLTEQELDAATDQARQAIQAVQQRRQGGDLRWMELPYADTGAIEQIAAELRDQFENFVVLGIGGSALGNIAIS
jgi:glucose-6-phosphate isomerase